MDIPRSLSEPRQSSLKTTTNTVSDELPHFFKWKQLFVLNVGTRKGFVCVIQVCSWSDARMNSMWWCRVKNSYCFHNICDDLKLYFCTHFSILTFHWLDFCNSRLAVKNFSGVSQGFAYHTYNCPWCIFEWVTKNQWFLSPNVILPLSPQKGLETTTFFLRLPYSEKTKQTSSAKHWHEWNPKPSGWRWKILERESRTGELYFNPITSRSSWLC